jgi:hypothetical protein
MIGKHVGSTAVRAFLLEKKPALCLCGHIHESAGKEMLGTVEVCNPGPFSAAHYAVVEVSDKQVSCEIRSLPVNTISRLHTSAKTLADKVVQFIKNRK